MEYRTIRIFPYDNRANTELRTYLAEGWQLHGSPFQARPEEYFQVVVRSKTITEPAGGPEAQKAAASLKEPGKGGSLSRG